MLYIEVAIVLFLIAVNGFLAMSELAVVSARRGRLQAMAAEGHRGAAVALELLANPGRFLSSVQIGITLVGVLNGVFSGATLAERLAQYLKAQGLAPGIADPIAFGGVVVGITYTSLIAGELVPKQLALRRPNRVAASVAPTMRAIARIAGPAVWLLDVSARLVLRLFKASATGKAKVTEEEIKHLVAEAEREGVVEPEERTMIARVMRLGDRTVRSIMTPRREVAWLDLADPEARQRETLMAAPHSRLLAARGSLDDVVGVVQARAVLNGLLAGRPLAVEHCVETVPHVSDGMRALDAIDALRESPARMALVYDEHGNFEGIVTDGDILRAIAGGLLDLPEDRPRATQRADGSWLVDAAMSLEDASELLNLSLPPERDYQTLAGLALDQLRRIPEVGDAFVHGAWQFEIVDMDGRRIDKLLATRLSPPPHRARATA